MTQLLNHIAPRFSEMEQTMASHIPQGGNWEDIPESVPSERVKQIRRNGGGRTTYYGRLRWDKPSYTISTYFNRIGNGCHIHPDQNRLISIREGARLQSFPDNFRFSGSKGAIYKQIGNALPPLLSFAIAKRLKNYVKSSHFIDLFAGAGGLSEGFRMSGFSPVAAIEIEKPFFETYIQNLKSKSSDGFICGNISEAMNQKKIVDEASRYNVDIISGGPPCQGFSFAGWYNPGDLRNQLFKEFVSMVSHLSPKVFLLENVMGMLSIEKGKFIERIISEFESIGYNINPVWKLNAAEYGVPQKRKRVFIVGTSNKETILPPDKILNEENFVTVKDAIYGLPSLKHGEGDEIIDCKIKAHSDYQRLMMGKISPDEFISTKKTITYNQI